MNQRLLVGAMSGTSADGVDAVLAAISGCPAPTAARILAFHHTPYPPSLTSSIHDLRAAPAITLPQLAQLAEHITLAYADCIHHLLAQAAIPPARIAAVAAHGQTLYHAPPHTIQWLDPALLAARTGCTVISDFRRADCAAGGQGAPLVPFADYILFHRPDAARVLLNLGGIANLTILAPATTPETLIAFDCGPANCLSDWLCRTHPQANAPHDVGGARALRGRVCPPAVEQFCAAPYFHQPPPKSTDGPEMIRLFDQAIRRHARDAPLDDLLATAAACVARTLAHALPKELPAMPAWRGWADVHQLVVAGGGLHNAGLMHAIAAQVRLPIVPSDSLGVPAQAREALAFALIADATLNRQPANVPSVTGAAARVILGSITPPPHHPPHPAATECTTA